MEFTEYISAFGQNTEKYRSEKTSRLGQFSRSDADIDYSSYTDVGFCEYSINSKIFFTHINVIYPKLYLKTLNTCPWNLIFHKGSSIKYVSKIFRKTNISNPVLNWWPLIPPHLVQSSEKKNTYAYAQSHKRKW